MRLYRIGGGGNQRGVLHRVSGGRGLYPRRFSPALWALASDFSLRGQRKVTKRKANPGKSSAARMPSARRSGRPYRRTRHFGLRHPWLRPKPASNILVLAPNRGRAVLALIRFGPCPAAAAPSSLTALLTRSTHLGDLQGGQYRARRRLSGLATRRSERWVSQYLAAPSSLMALLTLFPPLGGLEGVDNTVPDCDWVGSLLLCWPLRMRFPCWP